MKQTINGVERDIKPYADLGSANLTNARLTNARSYRANLYGANAHGANPYGATLPDGTKWVNQMDKFTNPQGDSNG